MKPYWIWMLAGMAGLALLLPQVAMANYYDDFGDGMWDDPNYWPDPCDKSTCLLKPVQGQWPVDSDDFDPSVYWDVDDPHWQIYALFGASHSVAIDPNYGPGLHLFTTDTFGLALIGAIVNSPPWTYNLYPDMNQDPNNSDTFWGPETSHYMLAELRWADDPDKGEGVVALHVDSQSWTGMFLGLNKDASDDNPYLYMHCGTGGLEWFGPGLRITSSHNHEPNYAGEPVDLTNGIWMLMQFDAADPNDSSTQRWKSAAWAGEKYDWDGDWLMITQFDTGEPLYVEGRPGYKGTWDPCDPDTYQPYEKGVNLLAAYGISLANLPAWCIFSDVEARTGTFSNDAKTLTLHVGHPENGDVEINPDLPDPNDPATEEDRLLQYTDGTEVVLIAHPDPNGKGFNKWEVTDPVDANNNFTDTNMVLYLTMDRDWEVAAKFKCGSAGLMPLVAAFGILSLAVVVRRRFL